jgi:drug/metabolite transporter (DMT)-like permease
MIGQASLFSLPVPREAWFPLKPRTLWTFVGAAAIPLWATWPLLAVLSVDIPLFQFLAMIFAVGAALLFALPKPSSEAAASAQSQHGWLGNWLPAIMVSVGILLSDIFFIWAFRFIPPAQANLILYTWPVMVVLLGGALGLLTLRLRHLVSIGIGLLGAALVIGTEVSGATWQGIALAAAGGLAWAVFVVFRLWQGQNAPDALTPGFALSAVISLVLHLSTETTVVPPAGALLSAILVGAIPLALGNLAWDYGIRRGDRVLLAVLAYATPLVGALILVAAGFATATAGLFIGGAMIVLAGIVSAR